MHYFGRVLPRFPEHPVCVCVCVSTTLVVNTLLFATAESWNYRVPLWDGPPRASFHLLESPPPFAMCQEAWVILIKILYLPVNQPGLHHTVASELLIDQKMFWKKKEKSKEKHAESDVNVPSAIKAECLWKQLLHWDQVCSGCTDGNAGLWCTHLKVELDRWVDSVYLLFDIKNIRQLIWKLIN